MTHTLKILFIAQVTHDVRCLRIEKPLGYTFISGQATEVAINKEGWLSEKRPFTFTSLNDDPYLEFTIKCYSDHDGVTNQIGLLREGDELIVDEPWGAIAYQGPGYFIAGGAGITPFIAILRQLSKEGKAAGNKLFFSNKTSADIIYEQELKQILGNDALFLVTESKEGPYMHDFIDEMFLSIHVDDLEKHFYICGPEQMTKSIIQVLTKQGASPDAVIFEK